MTSQMKYGTEYQPAFVAVAFTSHLDSYDTLPSWSPCFHPIIYSRQSSQIFPFKIWVGSCLFSAQKLLMFTISLREQALQCPMRPCKMSVSPLTCFLLLLFLVLLTPDELIGHLQPIHSPHSLLPQIPCIVVPKHSHIEMHDIL